MKRLNQLLAAGFMALLVPLAVAVPTLAQQATCGIGFTGPDSQNNCTSTTSYSCEVTNTNQVTITNNVTQEAVSGEVQNSGSGTTGGASSGTVTNTNGTTFTVSITNPVGENQGMCSATVVVPATTTPTTPVQPAVTSAPTGSGAMTLPATSGSPLLFIAAIVAAVLAALAIVASVAFYMYRHQPKE